MIVWLAGYLSPSPHPQCVPPSRTGQTTWADAQAKCTAAGDKGLATIDNAEENAAVLSILAGTDAYIGLSDTATEVRN